MRVVNKGVIVNDKGILIQDIHGNEIISWTSDELTNNYDAVLVSGVSIKMYYEQGETVLKEILTLANLINKNSEPIGGM